MSLNENIVMGSSISLTGEQIAEHLVSIVNGDLEPVIAFYNKNGYIKEALVLFEEPEDSFGEDFCLDTKLQEKIDSIYDECGDFYYTPMYLACMNNHIDIVKFFVEVAEISSEEEPIGESSFNPLQGASAYSNNEIARFLITKGANVNSQSYWGTTALGLAIDNNNIELALFLLDCGADPTIENQDGWGGGESCIEKAVALGNKEILQKIVDKGWEITSDSEDEYIPVYIQVIDKLKDSQCNQNELDTALESAVKQNNSEAVRYLLKAGANPTTQINHIVDFYNYVSLCDWISEEEAIACGYIKVLSILELAYILNVPEVVAVFMEEIASDE